MKTIQQIREELAAAGKPVSVPQLYRYFRRLGLQPVARMRPALYPEDTAAQILAALGLVKTGHPGNRRFFGKEGV